MPNSALYNRIRLLAGLLTLAMIVGQYYLPKRRIDLIDPSQILSHVYSDDRYQGPSKAKWIDQSKLHNHCHFPRNQGGPSFCGMEVAWNEAQDKGFDLRGYDGIVLKINYQGDGGRIRIFLRNRNPDYYDPKDDNSRKFMSTLVRSRDLNQEIFIDLSEFQVADWWQAYYATNRQLSGVEFDNIVAWGIDHIDFGDHTLAIEKAELVGDWIKAENLYLALISFWLIVIFWEGLSRLKILSLKARTDTNIINNLVDSYQRLEEKSQKYHSMSRHDILTGTLNRFGIMDSLHREIKAEQFTSAAALLLLDIDHFKNINDKQGHDIGDKVLSEIGALLLKNKRQHDIIGRWGGEEFLFIFLDMDANKAKAVSEKLRKMIADYKFQFGDLTLSVTASIGYSLLHSVEDFEEAFKHADTALYRAKAMGRNRVVAG